MVCFGSRSSEPSGLSLRHTCSAKPSRAEEQDRPTRSTSHGVDSVNAPMFISCDEDIRKTMNRAGLAGVEVLDLPEFIARYVTR